MQYYDYQTSAAHMAHVRTLGSIALASLLSLQQARAPAVGG